MEFSRTDTKVIKGIAIILMLYHHLFAFPDRIAEDILYIPLLRIGERSIDYYIGAFGKICVSLFLFLGGYGTYISTQKTPYDATRTLKIVLKKIKALYFEYWKVFFIFIPLCMLLDVSSMEKNVQIFCLNLVGLSTSYCGEWWFFTAYIGLLAVSPIIFSILEKSSCAIIDFIGLILFDIFVKCVLPELYECTWIMRIETICYGLHVA